ncbi:hypothetical protein [Wolbachia endosymbiont of Mansonella ozzardi]|uniref:hypothetical protein n=1 Tax=Wolbachia endosymbiont of Mansonella ozzardi TaxID=137464 RepID=UPI001CE1394A|nr:hypothetical protein [Wolbachia endosymbiont of Mansonella ozzardi]
MNIGKSKAASFGVGVATIGDFIKMVISGVLIGKYRSSNLDQEIDIILRFPEQDCNIKTIENLYS